MHSETSCAQTVHDVTLYLCGRWRISCTTYTMYLSCVVLILFEFDNNNNHNNYVGETGVS